MDRYRKINMALLSFIVLLLNVYLSVNGQADDFPGPYCASRKGGCCKDRKDSCSVPISSEFFPMPIDCKCVFFFFILLCDI